MIDSLLSPFPSLVSSDPSSTSDVGGLAEVALAVAGRVVLILTLEEGRSKGDGNLIQRIEHFVRNCLLALALPVFVSGNSIIMQQCTTQCTTDK